MRKRNETHMPNKNKTFLNENQPKNTNYNNCRIKLSRLLAVYKRTKTKIPKKIWDKNPKFTIVAQDTKHSILSSWTTTIRRISVIKMCFIPSNFITFFSSFSSVFSFLFLYISVVNCVPNTLLICFLFLLLNVRRAAPFNIYATQPVVL